jgi:hypothetical protein
MAVGLMEAFYLFDRYGKDVLETEEILFMAAAKKKKGCRMIRSTLTDEDIQGVIKIGLKIKKWKEENR